MKMRSLALLLALNGCDGSPEPPAHPTWADVEPILRVNCNHCHGATARQTGALGPAVYRFDFFDMTESVCGEAASAMDLPALAAASASLIRTDVSLRGEIPPRMPPAPAPPVPELQRQTLRRWGEQPLRGEMPWNNQLPVMRLRRFPHAAAAQLSFVAILEDADGQAVVGVLKIGEHVYKMDRAGAFEMSIDVSAWPAGSYPVSAVLCDGWINASYDFAPLEVRR
jgi:hypothetical protein